jgi:hypothetical protein
MFATETEPLLTTGQEARRLLGISNTKYWDLVKAGKIETVKLGSRKMPTYASLKRLADPQATAP